MMKSDTATELVQSGIKSVQLRRKTHEPSQLVTFEKWMNSDI